MDARKLHSPKTLKRTLETPLLGDSRSSISVRLFCLAVSKMGFIYVTQRASLFEYCPAHWCLFDGLPKAFPERQREMKTKFKLTSKMSPACFLLTKFPKPAYTCSWKGKRAQVAAT